MGRNSTPLTKATSPHDRMSPEDDFGLLTYDLAFSNTAHCRSLICYIGGEECLLEIPTCRPLGSGL